MHKRFINMYEKCTGICKLTFIPVYPQFKFREWTLVYILPVCKGCSMFIYTWGKDFCMIMPVITQGILGPSNLGVATCAWHACATCKKVFVSVEAHRHASDDAVTMCPRPMYPQRLFLDGLPLVCYVPGWWMSLGKIISWMTRPLEKRPLDDMSHGRMLPDNEWPGRIIKTLGHWATYG